MTIDMTRTTCPDGGTCHGRSFASIERCPPRYCYRVETCEPLSDVFPGDEWPKWIVYRYRPEPRFVPEVLEDEYGDNYYAEGHLPWRYMVIGALKEQRLNVDRETAVELFHDIGGRAGAPLHVHHEWYIEDADNEEVSHRVAADHPGARPYTRLER